MFEKAGGCECINGLDSPRCKATTKEEVLAFIPDECLYKYHEVAYYCYLREGILIQLYSYRSKQLFFTCMIQFWILIYCNKSLVVVHLLTEFRIEDSFLSLFVATRIAQDVADTVVANNLIPLETS